MKKFFFCLKKTIISCFILYAFNYIATDFSVIIPINICSVLLVAFFGHFGLLGLIFFKYFIM